MRTARHICRLCHPWRRLRFEQVTIFYACFENPVQPVEGGYAVPLGVCRIIEHMVYKVPYVSIQCHDRLSDVDQVTCRFTNYMDSKQLERFGVEHQLQETILVI